MNFKYFLPLFLVLFFSSGVFATIYTFDDFSSTYIDQWGSSWIDTNWASIGGINTCTDCNLGVSTEEYTGLLTGYSYIEGTQADDRALTLTYNKNIDLNYFIFTDFSIKFDNNLSENDSGLYFGVIPSSNDITTDINLDNNIFFHISNQDSKVYYEVYGDVIGFDSIPISDFDFNTLMIKITTASPPLFNVKFLIDDIVKANQDFNLNFQTVKSVLQNYSFTNNAISKFNFDDFNITRSLDLNLVDDFEDNDYTNNPQWNCEVGGGCNIDNTDGNYHGLKGLKIYHDRLALIYNPGFVTDQYIFDSNSYSVYFMARDNTSGRSPYLLMNGPTFAADSIGEIKIRVDNNNWRAYTHLSGNVDMNIGTNCIWSPEIWYKLKIDYNKLDGNTSFYIYQGDTNLVCSIENVAGDSGEDIKRIALIGDSGSNGNTYFDYVLTGRVEVQNYTIDFNVFKSGTSLDLNHISMDCTEGYSETDINSPFSKMFEQGVYSCDFWADGYDTNYAIPIVADSNKNYIIYLNRIDTFPLIIRMLNFNTWKSIDFNAQIDVNFKGVAKAIAKYSMDGSPFYDFNFSLADTNFYIPIVLDGNHTIDYWFQNISGEDTNGTSYALKDSTAPTVGVTSVTLFGISGAWIGGSGTIVGGAAVDGISGIDYSSCQYTPNNGLNWYSGSWNTDHCEKTSYVIVDGTSYTFNTRVDNNAGLTGTGTATSTYTGDAVSPTTTISGCTTGWHTSAQTITLTSIDAKSGIAQTQYRLNGGAWNIYGGPFVLPGDLNYQIDYNSIDAVGNTETTKIGYCAIDTTAPSVGATSLAGFTVFGNFFKGSGTILGGAATDGVSGINTSTCEYTQDGAVSWLAAVWNTDHCEKTAWTGTNGLKYTFNTRVQNNAGLTGTGAASMANYTYDTNGPQTTLSSIVNSIDVNVSLKCRDDNSGCKYIWYNIDSTGWQRTTSPSADFNWFIVVGTGMHSVQYLSTDNLDTNEIVNSSSFGVAGQLHVRVADENTGLFLNGVTANFNSINYTIDYNKDINLLGLATGNYVITFSKIGYGTRYYQMDMNQYYNYDINILLLSTSIGGDLSYIVYGPDEITLLAGYYFEVKRNDRNNYSIGRRLLNSGAETTMFTNLLDQNYNEYATSGSTIYTYIPLKLTVYIPKDEITLLTLTVPYVIDITGAMNKNDYNLTTDRNYILMSNVNTPYTFKIQDNNRTAYYQRVYALGWKGDTNYDTLQPYLLPVGFGSQVVLVVENDVKNTVPGIVIKLYKSINGLRTLYTSGTTNNYGELLLYLSTSDTYELELYRDGALIYYTNNFTVTSSKVTFQVTLQQTSIIPTLISTARIVWNPGIETVYNDVSELRQVVYGTFLNWAKVRVYQYLSDVNFAGDTNTLSSWEGPCNGGCTMITTLSTLYYIHNKPVFVDVNVYGDNNLSIYSYSHRYVINYTTGSNIITLMRDSRRSLDSSCSTDWTLPCGMSIIVSILITIFAIIFIIYKLGFVSVGGTILIALLILGILTFVGWFYWVLYGVVVLIGVLGYLGRIVMG